MSNIGRRPSSKRTGDRKTLNVHWPKISLLALHMASPDPGWGLPVKSRKIDRKLNFFLKIFEVQKKSLVLKSGFQKSHPFGDFPSLSPNFPYVLLWRGIEKGIKAIPFGSLAETILSFVLYLNAHTFISNVEQRSPQTLSMVVFCNFSIITLEYIKQRYFAIISQKIYFRLRKIIKL